jgi:hypothetical protein
MTPTHPWDENRWWHTAEMRGPLPPGITLDIADRAMERAAQVFNAEWCATTSAHPAFCCMHMKGSMPFRFFLDLGQDLLAVSECLRRPSIEKDLRQENSFVSTRFELEIAALLAKAGHVVEFRPLLSNTKSADLAVSENGGKTHYEIKLLNGEEAHLYVGVLHMQIAEAMSSLTIGNHDPTPSLGYEVTVAPSILNILGGGAEVDSATCAAILSDFHASCSRNVSSPPTPVVFSAGAHIQVRIAPGITSSVGGPPMSPDSELKRILRKHLKKPIDQLPLSGPGILIIQPSSVISPATSHPIIQNLMSRWGSSGSHISAVMFLPIKGTDMVPWMLFEPFAVLNPHARVHAPDIPSFATMVEASGCRIY